MTFDVEDFLPHKEKRMDQVLDEAPGTTKHKLLKIAHQFNIAQDDPAWLMAQLFQSAEKMSENAKNHAAELTAEKEKILAELKRDFMKSAGEETALVLNEKGVEIVEILGAATQKNRRELGATFKQFKQAVERSQSNYTKKMEAYNMLAIDEIKHKALSEIKKHEDHNDDDVINKYMLPVAASICSSFFCTIIFLKLVNFF